MFQRISFLPAIQKKHVNAQNRLEGFLQLS